MKLIVHRGTKEIGGSCIELATATTRLVLDVGSTIEFSTVDAGGTTKPIAWVSSLTNEERERMTQRDGNTIAFDQAMLGRRALVAGHDIAGKSGRYRHARILKWLDVA
jgi:hypothetical protein